MRFGAVLTGLFLILALPVLAQGSGMGGMGGMQGAGQTQNMPMSVGVVRRVDKASRRITIRHGGLYNLDMPAMTMAFRVSDPTMLDQVKVGDPVRFVADPVDGVLVITYIETNLP